MPMTRAVHERADLISSKSVGINTASSRTPPPKPHWRRNRTGKVTVVEARVRNYGETEGSARGSTPRRIMTRSLKKAWDNSTASFWIQSSRDAEAPGKAFGHLF